ncbi:hypothetical protein V2G26_014035 [Clonostachys chloroleuca]
MDVVCVCVMPQRLQRFAFLGQSVSCNSQSRDSSRCYCSQVSADVFWPFGPSLNLESVAARELVEDDSLY